MFRKFIYILIPGLVLSLFGCVIILKEDNPGKGYLIYVKTTDDSRHIELTETPHQPNLDLKDSCSVFELPKQEPQPLPPDLKKPEYKTYIDVEKALALYIIALKKHNAEERKKLEAAHRLYLKNCGH